MAQLDTGVFDKIRTFGDYQKADQEFQMRRALALQAAQTGGIDAATKANVYKTQVVSAATASGNQADYDRARQTLQSQGIDISDLAPDVGTAAQQAQAGRLAQSPLGSLLNAGLKGEANNIAATQAMGSAAGGAQLDPLSQAVAGKVGLGIIGGAKPVIAAPEGNPAPPAASRRPMSQADQNSAMNELYPDNSPPPAPVIITRDATPPQTMKFSPPPQQAGETNQAYNQRVQTAFEAYKSDPNYLSSAKQAEETGTTTAKNIEMAKKADELTKRLEMNLNAMLKVNPDVPYSGITPGSWDAYVSQAEGAHPSLAKNGLGDNGMAANAANQWDQINNQQILSEIQQFIASGGANTRTNQTLERIVRAASGINRNDLPASREAQIKNALVEIQNKNVSAQNLAGGNQSYSPVPVVTSQQSTAPKPGDTMQGTDGTYLFNGGDPSQQSSWKKVK